MNSKIRVRLVWRLVLCLCAHLTLLLILAIYLQLSLDSLRRYAPIATAKEVQLESLDVIPALLSAMDVERRAYQREGDPRERVLFARNRGQVEANLAALQQEGLPSGPEENERRAVVREWIEGSGFDGIHPPLNDAQSRNLLDRLDPISDRVRSEVDATLSSLKAQEANELSERVTLMWILVGSVMIFTILIQLILSRTIIGPIQTLQTAVRLLQSGDYTARAHLNTGDEVQLLGETFNGMAESILRSQQELQEKNGTLSAQQEALRQANANLGERVLEKTRQIQETLAEAEADRAKLLALRQELEEKNQKLNEAARLKDEFLATLSHELRTPLTPVITCAHLLGSDDRLESDHLRNVQVIERNARALSRMIDELLDLSAVMNRKLLLIRERTELNEWTRVTLETMRPAWEKKELSMRFVPSGQTVQLEIDPNRLAQVLTNLINNAIKFTDPGGKIEVRLTSFKKEVRIAVTDTGPGLNRHEIERIFEMFHQTRTRRTQGVGGLGVGLSVARSLAELHGGGLRAESPGLGEGATFTFWLPCGQAAASDFSSTGLMPPVPQVDRSLLRGRRILLVEDATDTREALQRIFERRQCQVRTAATGEEALALALAEPPEIIISDIGLPGMSGLEFMARLKAQPDFQEMVTVALSGLGRERDIRAASEVGFDAHLLKPVEIMVLDQTLVDALQRKSLVPSA